jgi:hypothetical protein
MTKLMPRTPPYIIIQLIHKELRESIQVTSLEHSNVAGQSTIQNYYNSLATLYSLTERTIAKQMGVPAHLTHTSLSSLTSVYTEGL